MEMTRDWHEYRCQMTILCWDLNICVDCDDECQIKRILPTRLTQYQPSHETPICVRKIFCGGQSSNLQHEWIPMHALHANATWVFALDSKTRNQCNQNEPPGTKSCWDFVSGLFSILSVSLSSTGQIQIRFTKKVLSWNTPLKALWCLTLRPNQST